MPADPGPSPDKRGVADRPRRALIAEDTYAWRYAIVELLEGAGFHCVAVEDGEAAALLLADPAHAFDIAITDFRMPRGSGWRVIEAARAHRGPAFPVIMQTAESQYSDVHARAAELSVPVIAKDHLLRTLLAAVERALASR